MAEKYLIGDLYPVEVDGSDWPVGLPASERPSLMAIVLEVLEERAPLSNVTLYRVVQGHPEIASRCPTYARAALFDFAYACLVRACRAVDAEPHWHAPKRYAVNDRERVDLDAYAVRIGRRWRSALQRAWDGVEDPSATGATPRLMRLKDATYFGLEGLAKYKTTTADVTKVLTECQRASDDMCRVMGGSTKVNPDLAHERVQRMASKAAREDDN